MEITKMEVSNMTFSFNPLICSVVPPATGENPSFPSWAGIDADLLKDFFRFFPIEPIDISQFTY